MSARAGRAVAACATLRPLALSGLAGLRPLVLSGLAGLWLLVMSGLAAAQTPDTPEAAPVTLVADVVAVESPDRITASGNVELFADGRSLSAGSLAFDRSTGVVTVTGPIVLRDGEDVLVFADAAELDADLREGVFSGVRVVLGRQLQIAGAELRRRDGRFNEVRSVAASSCEVCIPGQPPLWEVRADRVIHDEEAGRVYFYGARFRISGVPVFYLPVFRLPDGTRSRVSGLLTPSFRTTTQLGPGIKLPVFFTLGRSADITLTPYVSTGWTRTLEARYRQMLRNGELAFEGALTRDSILPGEWRGYLFGSGRFDIPRDYELTFNIETASDDPYLQDYDYSSADRLESTLGVLRTRGRERVEAEAVYFQSLRADEDNDLIPTLVGDVAWNRRWLTPGPGGWLDFDLIARGHMRPSTENVVGRDMADIRATASWARIWTSGGGLRLSADARLNADLKFIWQDDRYDVRQSALTPQAALTLGWPMAARGADGARYLLEPVAQVMWTASDRIRSPNDDSTLISFDTGNLLSFNRFPGLDRYEEGLHANLALRWTRFDRSGWSLAMTLGKVYRKSDQEQFPRSTGLAGTSSDWMVQSDVDFGRRLALRNLLLLDTGFEATLNETRLAWQGEGLTLASTYVWQRADRLLELDEDLSELAIDAAYDITDSWAMGLDLRRDLTGDRTNRAALELSWQNECVRVDLSALRRFRATEDIEPTTSYGLSVTLAGFNPDERRPARLQRCTRR